MAVTFDNQIQNLLGPGADPYEVMGQAVVFTALHWMQGGLVRRKLSVRLCLPIHLSLKRVDCDRTEESSAQIFIPYESSFSLVFW